MASSLIVTASALLSFAAAAPTQDGIRSGLLEARQAPNCNIGTSVTNAAAYDSSCWNSLNIMSYLTNWKTTTPTCTDAESSAGQTLSCCVASEPWSTCFLRLATRQANAYDCTQIGTTTCSYPAKLDPGLSSTIASQVNYIVLNIMTINSFFVSYFKALQTAMESENPTLTSYGNVNVNVPNFMAALTLGLAFPQFLTPKQAIVSSSADGTTSATFSKRDPQDSNSGTSTGSSPQSSPSIAVSGCTYSWLAAYYQNGRHNRRQQPEDCPNATAEADPNASLPLTLDQTSPPVVIFNAALQQSPNIASSMWPSSPSSDTVTLTDLATGPLFFSSLVPPILNAGLQLIMSDIPTFTAFAANGIFSTPFSNFDQPSGYKAGFTSALDTYIISEMLLGNSVSAIPGPVGLNPCTSESLCDGYYFSPVTQRQYTFQGSNMFSLITQAQSTTKVDLPTLFDGAYNCTFEGLAGGSVVGLQADNSLNMACLSVLPMYIQGDCPQGATWVGDKCPFGYVG